MALTFDDLKKLLDTENVKYFQHPTSPLVLAGFTGTQGSYQITIGLHIDGQFLQFRTTHYATCKPDSPHAPAVLNLLAALNFKTRWVKWAWDCNDGDIAAMGDMWIMDGTVTTAQFSRMLGNILPAIDVASPRIKAVIDTGTDPGEPDPMELFKKALDKVDAPPSSPPNPEPVTEI